jgi:hypothetical protein
MGSAAVTGSTAAVMPAIFSKSLFGSHECQAVDTRHSLRYCFTFQGC